MEFEQFGEIIHSRNDSKDSKGLYVPPPPDACCCCCCGSSVIVENIPSTVE